MADPNDAHSQDANIENNDEREASLGSDGDGQIPSHLSNSGEGFESLYRSKLEEIAQLRQDLLDKRRHIAERESYLFEDNPGNVNGSGVKEAINQARQSLLLIRKEQASVMAKTLLYGEYAAQTERKTKELRIQFNRLCLPASKRIPTLMQRMNDFTVSLEEKLVNCQATLNKMTVSETEQYAACKQIMDSLEERMKLELEKQVATKAESEAKTARASQLHAELAEEEVAEQETLQLIRQQQAAKENVASLLQTYATKSNEQIVMASDDKITAEQLQNSRGSYQKAREMSTKLANEQDELVLELRKAREAEMVLDAEARSLAAQEESGKSQFPGKLSALEDRIKHENQIVDSLRKNLSEHMARTEMRRKKIEQELLARQKQQAEKLQQKQERDRQERAQRILHNHIIAKRASEKSRHEARVVSAPRVAEPIAHKSSAFPSKPPQHYTQPLNSPKKTFHLLSSPPPPPMAIFGSSKKASPGKLKPSESFKRPKSPSQPTSPTIRKRLSFRGTVHSPPPMPRAAPEQQQHQFKVPLPLRSRKLSVSPPSSSSPHSLRVQHHSPPPDGSQLTSATGTSTTFLDMDSDIVNVTIGKEKNRRKSSNISDVSTVSQFSLSRLM